VREVMKVLFLCTGNSCRSQMAEGWLRVLGGDQFEVSSAGIEAHGKNPRAITVMHEVGVDISSQSSEVLNSEQLADLNLLVTVCGHADELCPTVPVPCRKEHWPFDDPAQVRGTDEEIMEAFRAARDQIRLCISAFVKREQVSLEQV